MRPFLYLDVLKGRNTGVFLRAFERKAIWKCFFMPLVSPSVSWPTTSDVYPGMQGEVHGGLERPLPQVHQDEGTPQDGRAKQVWGTRAHSFSVTSSPTDSI